MYGASPGLGPWEAGIVTLKLDHICVYGIGRCLLCIEDEENHYSRRPSRRTELAVNQ